MRKKKFVAPSRWDSLSGTYRRDAEHLDRVLHAMRAADHLAAEEVKKARAALEGDKASDVSRAKKIVIAAYEVVADALKRACLSASESLRKLPKYYDQSHAFTMAHDLADAHDAEAARLYQVRVALSRASIGDRAQVSSALDAAKDLWAGPNPCGCAAPPDRTITPVAEATVAEPLMAIAESSDVYAYGACAMVDGSQDRTVPIAFSFERVRERADGSRSIVQESEREIPADVVDTWMRGEGCLPWARIERDPKNFGACAKAAKVFGPVNSSKDVYNIVRQFFAKQDTEVFAIMGLDVQKHVRILSELARGSRNFANASVPDALRVALIDGCTSVVCIHNHPSGVVKPSSSDAAMTRALQTAFHQVGIRMVDHVIVGHSSFYSFADHGQMG